MVQRILVGAIIGAHGIAGAVKLKCFTVEPAAVASYGPLTDEAGARTFNLTVVGRIKGGVIARLAGVTDRNGAEALKGQRLYVERAALPAADDGEYYHVDLVGLAATRADGAPVGRVIAVHNHGAGDILEIAPPAGPTLLLPFTRSAVPSIDLAAGRLVVDPPIEVEAKPAEDDTDVAA